MKQQTLQLNSICFVSRKSALRLSLHLQDFLLKSRLALLSTRMPSNVKGREKVTQGEERKAREEREESARRGRIEEKDEEGEGKTTALCNLYFT